MINYSLVLRGDPRSPEKGKKVFASAQGQKTMTLKDVVKHMAEHGEKYKEGDYKAMIANLTREMVELLREGNRLELDELGRFYTTLECIGAETTEEFDPKQNITGLKVNWKPSDTFQNLRKGVKFKENVDRRTEKSQLRAAQKRRAEEEEE